MIEAIKIVILVLCLPPPSWNLMSWSSSSSTDMEQVPRKRHKYYQHTSNWSYRLLGSQGYLMTPLRLPVYADSSFSLEFDVTVYSSELQFKTSWESQRADAGGDSELAGDSTLFNNPWVSVTRNDHWVSIMTDLQILDQLKPYMYGNLTAELKRRNLIFPVPAEHFEEFVFLRLKVSLPPNLSVVGFKMRLNVPVRQLRTRAQFVQVDFVDTFLEPNNTTLICSGRNYFGEADGLHRFALIIDNKARFFFQLGKIVPIPNLLYCDALVCEIRKPLFAKIPFQPCITAIHMNVPIEKLQEACKLPCLSTGSTPHTMLEVSVVKFNEKLMISRITEPLHVICINGSNSKIVQVPPRGALEMAIPCECKIIHGSKLLYDARYAYPLKCPEDWASEVYQILPSIFAPLERHEQALLLKITHSELESRVFYNMSGVLLAEDVIDYYFAIEVMKLGLPPAIFTIAFGVLVCVVICRFKLLELIKNGIWFSYQIIFKLWLLLRLRSLREDQYADAVIALLWNVVLGHKLLIGFSFTYNLYLKLNTIPYLHPKQFELNYFVMSKLFPSLF